MRKLSMSALGGKADIPDRRSECPLMTQSGHSLPTRAARAMRDERPGTRYGGTQERGAGPNEPPKFRRWLP